MLNNGLDISHCEDYDLLIKQLKLSDKSLISFLKDEKYAEKSLDNYKTYMQESASVTSSFGKVLKGVGASLASMAVTAIATELLSFLYKVGNVSNEVANAAAQAGEAFNSTKDDIEGYILE